MARSREKRFLLLVVILAGVMVAGRSAAESRVGAAVADITAARLQSLLAHSCAGSARI